jgi:endonuclease/exonuclease/phosphatase family metal-dependent hydrolase
MKALKFILKGIILLIILFGLFLLYATISNYKPPVSEVVFESTSPDTIPGETNLGFMIWNIGYSGLSADMDFFYDGGVQVRTSKENVFTNIDKNLELIKSNDSLDFILLQEVDEYSRRSYFTNQIDSIGKRLKNHQGFFGKNYDVKFVPIPPTNPLGRVKSGLNSYSFYTPSSVVRYSFPGSFDWPVSIFNLDRCFLVMRFPTTTGKELLVINTHNSAYDDGSLKKQEMEYLKTFVTEEFNKGNYIIVGGDWNQNPPELDQKIYGKKDTAKRFVLNPIPSDYLPTGWSWIFDPEIPSNRYLNMPYNEEESIKVTIDFFLASPNIEKVIVQGIDLDFKHSDHQPVICVVKLK